jgi:type I restriction enzyme R subunit
MPAAIPSSANFGYLAAHDPQLDHLGVLAERFADDRSTSLIKLRQFAEVLAQRTASRTGLYTNTAETQLDLLHQLRDFGVLPREIADLFH